MRKKPQKNWTQHEIKKLIELRNNGLNFYQIANELNRTYTSVQRKYKQYEKEIN